MVTQEPVLLPGSIRDNIAYARPSATDEEVVSAAKAANAHAFITSLVDGYETQLGGGGGGGLSVGQKQRLAIARALLKDPKVCCALPRLLAPHLHWPLCSPLHSPQPASLPARIAARIIAA